MHFNNLNEALKFRLVCPFCKKSPQELYANFVSKWHDGGFEIKISQSSDQIIVPFSLDSFQLSHKSEKQKAKLLINQFDNSLLVSFANRDKSVPLRLIQLCKDIKQHCILNVSCKEDHGEAGYWGYKILFDVNYNKSCITNIQSSIEHMFIHNLVNLYLDTDNNFLRISNSRPEKAFMTLEDFDVPFSDPNVLMDEIKALLLLS